MATAADCAVFSPPGDRKGVPDVVQLSTGTPIDYEWEHTPRPVASDPPLLVWDTGNDWWSRGPNGFVTKELPEGKDQRGRERPDRVEFTAEAGTGGPYVWGTYVPKQGADASAPPTECADEDTPVYEVYRVTPT